MSAEKDFQQFVVIFRSWESNLKIDAGTRGRGDAETPKIFILCCEREFMEV
ncbi:MAG: hypothetical protein F6K41_39975 [Symploca sp. SIO3E6]|nr:hypothetical protein [Caldora sp. SIO3E6]